MAPEVILGARPSPASDIYAVGVILYELLTGTTPFGGGAAMDIFSRHVLDPLVPPSVRFPDRPIPRELEEVLARALAKDLTHRFTDTTRFAAALAAMRVVMTDRGGKELASGKGTAILDHPLNAVLWLVQDLEKSRVKLKPGDLLSLGSFTPPLPPRPGLTVTVRYEGLPGNPAVTVRFR